jgi:inosose dehydratase
MSWTRFLDEVAVAGYEYIELGPYGYLPTDENHLRDELAQRGIGLLAGTLIDNLHLPAERARIRKRARQICGLVSKFDARFLVLIADIYRTPETGFRMPTELALEDWRAMIETTNELGRLIRDEFGMLLSFHPHADSVVEYTRQIDRFLDDTDSGAVHLCLDTGHLEYRDGDSATLMRERFERIPYLHLKSVNADLKAKIHTDDIDFVTAVRMGVMCEPDEGIVDFTALDRAMRDLTWDGWAIVEQDMFPLNNHDTPLPVATRTRHYFESLGWRTH